MSDDAMQAAIDAFGAAERKAKMGIDKNTQTAAPQVQYTVTSKRDPAGPTAFERQFGPDPALKHGATAQALYDAHLSGWNAALKAVRERLELIASDYDQSPSMSTWASTVRYCAARISDELEQPT